ncbi:helix-turn-helix domain-containing protein [Mycobacteroides abscessus subsp. bolletii]|nr:helix-turn-helix domain-containing protein [Mycobacteroides abscessus subsp. bolletii]
MTPIDEALSQLGGIGRTTLYELAKRGDLTKVHIGRRGFITTASLMAYVERLADGAA